MELPSRMLAPTRHACVDANAELRRDREFVLAAVGKNGAALEDADDSLKRDGCRNHACVDANAELTRDREFVLADVCNNAATLQDARAYASRPRMIVEIMMMCWT